MLHQTWTTKGMFGREGRNQVRASLQLHPQSDNNGTFCQVSKLQNYDEKM
jgi:hypothetical protein